MSDALVLDLGLEPMTVIGRPQRMGAVELIELGRANASGAPMIANAPKRIANARLGILGDVVNYLFTFVGNGLTSVTNVLSQILAVPVSLVGGGINVVLTSFAGVVGQIPVIGELVAGILIAANAVIQAAIQIPGQILEMLGNLGKAFATLTPEQQKSISGAAVQTLIASSPPEIKDKVTEAVEAAPPPGGISSGSDKEPSFSLLDGIMTLLSGGGLAALALL